MMGMVRLALAAAIMPLLGRVCRAETGATLLATRERVAALEALFDVQVNGWWAHTGDPPGAEKPAFDDSRWDVADVGHGWPPGGVCWFRRWVEVPQKVGGVPVKGAEVAIRLKVDNGGRVYVNGEFKQELDKRGEARVVLTTHAKPGDRFLVAVRATIKPYPGYRPWSGSLSAACLEASSAADVLPRVSKLLAKMRFALDLVQAGAHRRKWCDGLAATLAALDPEALGRNEKNAFLNSLKRAESVFQDRVVGVIRRATEERLASLAPQVHALRRSIRQAEKRDIDLAYQRVTLTVAENFGRFARDDIASDNMEIVVRSMWNADWLANAVPGALAEARAILRDPSRQRRVPRYKTGPVQIRGGAFFQGERPLFFVGMGHFGQVRRDIPIFPDYGFNIVQITIGVGSVLTGPDTVNVKPIEEVVAVLDRAAKANVAVDLLLEPHGWPGWANKKYPEIAKERTFPYFNYRLDHRRAQEILEKYWGILIPRIAGHPALFSYCLFNEPRYTDYSDFSHARFRQWLRRKHGTLAVLNERHRSNYASFDAVPIPHDEADRALWYDWCRFNQDRFSEVHEWMIKTLRALDPNTPMHSKVQAMLFDTCHIFLDGIDHERWTLATDISGNDNWSYRGKYGDYTAGWLRQAMYYDFQRSVAPNQPIFNSENHPIQDDQPTWVAGRHLRTMYWQGALHGQGATTTWVWERGDSSTLGHCIITRANCTEALGTVALDLLRLGEEVVALQQVKPEVALLVVPASIPFSESYLDEMRSAYEGLYFLGAPVGFVTDRQVRNGGLSAFKAVFVPRAMRIEDDLVARLGEYVARGGALVVVGDSFAMDEYSRPRELPEFLPGSANQARPRVAAVGKGMVIYRPGPLSAEAYRQLGETLMTDLKVDRPVRLTDEKGRIVPGVMYWSTRRDRGYLVNMVNYRSHEVPVRIVAAEKIELMINLFDGSAVPDFLELEPLRHLLLFVETAR